MSKYVTVVYRSFSHDDFCVAWGAVLSPDSAKFGVKTGQSNPSLMIPMVQLDRNFGMDDTKTRLDWNRLRLDGTKRAHVQSGWARLV